MNHPPRATTRALRTLLVAAATTTTALVGVLPAGAAARPALTLEAGQSRATFYRYVGEDEDGHQVTYVQGDLGVNVVADRGHAFEVRVQRKDYATPLVARLAGSGKGQTLPAPADLSGLVDFSRTTFRDAKGRIVATSTQTFCPNDYQPVRRFPQAPATSPYPSDCDGNPYSLGAVWGIQAGYAESLYAGWSSSEDLEPGSYLATTSITPAYRAALHIPVAQARTNVWVTVKDGDPCGAEDGCLAGARRSGASRTTPTAAARTALDRAPERLMGTRTTPTGPLPDLRSLPAWQITIDEDDADQLDFGATVWNAGPGRLVVDGFRDTKKADLMNAYQYFFSASGQQQGYAPVGGMEWDPREHHQHWHFKDFANYALVSADGKKRWDSGKEAFCLANTDAVDYTVKGANWRPENTDLSTACGGHDALGVREVLDAGSGDTYEQFREGQAFDLTKVPNGAYDIEVTANPVKRLYEASTSNNVSRRRIVLGGTKGKRTVTVSKVGIVVEPPVDGGGEPAVRR